MKGLPVSLLAAVVAAGLLISGCGQAAPAPTPTRAPAAPTKAAEPVKTAGPAVSTAAPTKAAEPTKAPAAQPTAAPAKKVDWPQKGRGISYIVPFAPGGSADVGARLVAAAVEKEIGNPVQIVTRAGAGSQLGVQELSLARPDGYTIGATLLPTTNTLYLDLERKAVFNRTSFQPIAGYALGPVVMTVKSDGPLKSLKDLIDGMKADPNRFKTSVSGRMGILHLAALQLGQLAGVKFNFVFFDSGGASVTALLGGHVDVAFSAATEALPHVKSGAHRALGIYSPKQSPSYPGVKTMEEMGYKVNMVTTHVVSAPAGTPMEIVDMLAAPIKKSLTDAQMQQRIGDAAMEPLYLDPAEVSTLWAQMDADAKPLMELGKEGAS